MILEWIITKFLNEVIGEYIENLDYTQIEISLWGGNLVLNDLVIKESVLNVLDLPVRLKYVRIGKLKILVKDIWNGQIDTIVVEELFILVVPTSQRKQLADIKSQENLDSMVKKLFAPMRNIHVEIKRIHVQYEDHLTLKESLVLNADLLLKVRTGEHQLIQSVEGSIKDLSLLTGIYNPVKRADSIYQVEQRLHGVHTPVQDPLKALLPRSKNFDQELVSCTQGLSLVNTIQVLGPGSGSVLRVANQLAAFSSELQADWLRVA